MEHKDDLSGIPLREWDGLPMPSIPIHMQKLGDSWSLSTHVCVYKEAAQQLIEEN
jgi:hypothetical protein